jgi:uncharacterized protein (TIGR03086 family)
MTVNIEPATKQLGALVRAVPDDALGAPTPTDMRVGALIDHIRTLSLAFAAAARKDVSSELTDPPPPVDVKNLPSDWRESIPRSLDALAAAWNDPASWEGMTKIAGMEMPGEAVGVVALDEVLIHGWDLARSTGQPFETDDHLLDALMGFLTHMAEPGMEPARKGLFGPVVPVPPDAPRLHQVLGLTGRDPKWSSPS